MFVGREYIILITMITKDKPVTNGEIQDLTDLIGVSELSMRYMLGVTNQSVRDEIFGPHKLYEQSDFTLGIMARILNDHPEFWPLPLWPRPQEVFDLVNQYVTISEQEFGNLFGRSGASGVRWLRKWVWAPSTPKGVNPHVQSMLVLVKSMILSTPLKNRPEIIKKLIETMKVEANARGFDMKELEERNRFVKQDQTE